MAVALCFTVTVLADEEGEGQEHHCEALNATWTSDGVCPEGCDKSGEPMVCTLQLVEGCFCAEDYVRERARSGCGPIEQEPDACGRCIRREDCPSNSSSSAA